MSTLHDCPYCGDTNADLKSGPCEYVAGQFMAQVHCGHCGAAGTRYAGEDSVEFAELRAAKAWNDVGEAPRGFFHYMIDASNVMVYATTVLIFIVYLLHTDLSLDFLVGLLLGSILIGIVSRHMLRRVFP